MALTQSAEFFQRLKLEDLDGEIENLYDQIFKNSKSITFNNVRFAPSPTGDFHIGNLRTALLAYKIARTSQKSLWIRFEDIDRERSFEKFVISQIHDMEKMGIAVPSPVDRQSSRLNFHYLVFLKLWREGAVYPCFCSRSEVQGALSSLASAPHQQMPLYSGHCRNTPVINSMAKLPLNEFVGWRIKIVDSPNGPKGYDDFLVAKSDALNFVETHFPIKNFVPSYHFACVLDDFFGKSELIVRAWDLESSMLPQQNFMNILFEKFSSCAPLRLPQVFHTSLVLDEHGNRLEKRTKGVTLKELLEKIQLDLVKNRLWNSLPDTASESHPEKKIFGEGKKSLTLSDLGLR